MACGCQKNNQNKVSPYVQNSQKLTINSNSSRTMLTTELLRRIEENKNKLKKGIQFPNNEGNTQGQ